MNQERMTGIWMRARGEAKVAWGTLTSNELAVAAGIRDRRAGQNRTRLGISKEKAARQLKEFLDRNRHWNPSHH